MPIQSKAKPVKIAASEWQTPDQALRGLFEGKDVQTGITFIRYVTDTVGEGPILHVHPYDEVFTIQEGRARFTIGNETIDAEAGTSSSDPPTSRMAIRTSDPDGSTRSISTSAQSGFNLISPNHGMNRACSCQRPRR